jgi:ABC-type phosphate transport system auxiliary subunit
MIKRLLSLAAMLIIGLVAYNMMFGDDADKENVKQITSGVKELLQSTKDKYKNGEYNEAIDKIGDVFKQLKDKAGELNNSDYIDRLSELEERKQHLEEMLKGLEEKENTATRSLVPQDLSKEKEVILRELEDLEREAGNLATDMDKQ